MLDLRAFLARLRPSAAPGAAAAAGVPADRVGELTAELEPVLALLADDERAADRVRADADVAAAACLRAAAARADAIIADAHREAAAELAAMRACAQAEAATHRDEVDASTKARVEDIRTHAAAHLDEVAAGAVAPVLAALLDNAASAGRLLEATR